MKLKKEEKKIKFNADIIDHFICEYIGLFHFICPK